MAVYYKFKSAKDFDTVPIEGHFVSVAILKEKIFESKHLGRGTDFDLVVTNFQTGEEYHDEETLIPKGTSVLIRRVPGRHRMPIVAQQQPHIENKVEDPEPPNSSFTGGDSSTMKYPDDTDWDEFGSDLYAIPEMTTVQFNNTVQEAPPPTQEDEDSKIQALIETPQLDWQGDGYGTGRGFGRGGRMMGGRGFGRIGLATDKRTPPPGYVCHRCKVPGHFIQHCPTNGDPNYDVKKAKPPTGIPKSMLFETPDGSYALPSGSVAVLKPNEAAFEKEIDGLPTTRSVGEIPAEHRCPLCKEIMKDAVITVKCCFATFCDRCIRDHLLSKSVCVCGQKDVLADDLIPNKLARDSISRFLECNNNNSSAENQGSTYQVQDVESARCPPARVPSPTFSAASKGEQPPAVVEENTPTHRVNEEEFEAAVVQQTPEKAKSSSKVAVSEATHESASAKEPASQTSAPHAEEVQQKATSETGKKIKKKKRAPANAAEMQWNNGQEYGGENYMMPMGPAGFNPYWNGMQPGMQPGMEAFIPPFGGPMPFMGGYPLGPMEMAYPGFMPQDPYSAPSLMYPPVRPQHPLQRGRPDFGMGFNNGPPLAMSREEFEARKDDMRRKREMEERHAGSLRGGGLPHRTREPSRDTTGGSINAKPKSRTAEEDDRNHHRRVSSSSSHHRSPSPRHPSVSNFRRRSPPSPPAPHRVAEIPRPPKRKSSERDRDYDDDRKCRNDHQSDRHCHHRSKSSDRKSAALDSASTGAVAKSELPVKASHTESKSNSAATTTEGKSKTSVFARISFPDEAGSGGSKKKKTSSSTSTGGGDSKVAVVTTSGGNKRKSGGSLSYAESSDEDRHFKRKPSRYESLAVDMDNRYSGGRSHR